MAGSIFYLAPVDNASGKIFGKKQKFVAVRRKQGKRQRGCAAMGERSTKFSHCLSLKSVTLPTSVNWIGRMAFSHCSSLKSVTLPKKLKKIEHSAFASCTSLTSVNIPTSVTEIEDMAFYGCKRLKSATLSYRLKNIAKNAFPKRTKIYRK
mgnify:FL=1